MKTSNLYTLLHCSLRPTVLRYILILAVANTDVLASAAEFIPLGADFGRNAVLSGDGSTLFGVVNDEVVRWRREEGVIPVDSSLTADIFSSNPVRTIKASNDGEVIIGRFPEPFVWANGLGVQYPGQPAFLRDVSADGSVVIGTFHDQDAQAIIPLRWTREAGFEQFPSLNFQSGINTFPMRLSADGSVIAVQSRSYIDIELGHLSLWMEGEPSIPIPNPIDDTLDAWGSAHVSDDGRTIVLMGSHSNYSMPGGYFYGSIQRWTSENGLQTLISDTNFINTRTFSYQWATDDLSAIALDVTGPNIRWTEEFGTQTLEKFPGFENEGVGDIVRGLSSDGTIFGENHQAGATWGDKSSYVLGFWLPDGTMKTLDEILDEQGLGADLLDDWGINGVYGMSKHGHVLALSGINPDGIAESFLLDLDPIMIPEPTTAALMMATLATLLLCKCSRRREARHSTV